MIGSWIENFTHDINNLSPDAESKLDSLLPPVSNELPDAKTIYESFGGAMFFLATGGEFDEKERLAYIDAVVNPLIFFPDWFNFLLAGHFMERKGLRGYYTLRGTLARYHDGPALRAVFKLADKNNMPRSEALRYVAVIFSIAGAAAPSTTGGFKVEVHQWLFGRAEPVFGS